MVKETPQDYVEKVKPWIISIPPERTKWIQQILDGQKEQDDLLLSDINRITGFILLPDMKWDRTTETTMYLLAIARNPSVKCIRDLNSTHIPLLENIRHKTSELVKQNYGLDSSQLRFFIHYHPSYYHFHVHVVHLKMEVTRGMICGQAYLLDDVIESLRMDSDFFNKRNLFYELSKNHELYSILVNKD